MLKTATSLSFVLLTGACVVVADDTQPRNNPPQGAGASNQASMRDNNTNAPTVRDRDAAGAATQASARFDNLTDEQFVAHAASGGMAEVKLSQFAADHATNADVKSFAQHMVTDHTKANDNLKQAAAGANITVPADIDARDKAMGDRVMAMKGDDFDRGFMRANIRDHEKTIALFEAEASHGKNDALKGFATSTLPTLRDHLKMAQDIGGKVGANSMNDDNAQPAGSKIQNAPDMGGVPAGNPIPNQGVEPREGAK